jgi:hypothetical protein
MRRAAPEEQVDLGAASRWAILVGEGCGEGSWSVGENLCVVSGGVAGIMNDEELGYWHAALWGLVEIAKRPAKDGGKRILKRSMPYFLWWDGLQAEVWRRFHQVRVS